MTVTEPAAVNQFVAEYSLNSDAYRRDSITLADYVETRLKDSDPAAVLSDELHDDLIDRQSEFGEVLDPRNPLAWSAGKNTLTAAERQALYDTRLP